MKSTPTLLAASFATTLATAVGMLAFPGCAHGVSSVSRSPASFEVQGHRGARGSRPENTLSAFRFALKAGVDTLEMDLNVTHDDVLVVTHDPALNPKICLAPSGKKITHTILVRGLTLQELKRYDCGTLINPRFPEQVPQPGEPIPTFDELLSWLDTDPDPRARVVRLNVETKSEEAHPEYTPPPEKFSALVLDALKRHHFMERTTLQSFDYRTLVAARALDPAIETSILVEERPSEPLTVLAKRYQGNIISPDHEWLTKSDVEELHQIGVRVIPWTVNTPDAWAKLSSWKIDGIISDNPAALLKFRSTLSK